MFSKKLFALVFCCVTNFNIFPNPGSKAKFHVHSNKTISSSLTMCTSFGAKGSFEAIFLNTMTKCPCVKDGNLYMGEHNLCKIKFVDYFLFFNPISGVNLINSTPVNARFIIKKSNTPYACLFLNNQIGHDYDVEIKPEGEILNVSISGKHHERKDAFILIMEIGTPLTITSLEKKGPIEIEQNS